MQPTPHDSTATPRPRASGGINELYYSQQHAVRKGRSKSPCILKVGITLEDEDNHIVLRALDKSGTASLVALLTPEQAEEMAEALKQSAQSVGYF